MLMVTMVQSSDRKENCRVASGWWCELAVMGNGVTEGKIALAGEPLYSLRTNRFVDFEIKEARHEKHHSHTVRRFGIAFRGAPGRRRWLQAPLRWQVSQRLEGVGREGSEARR